MKRKCLAFLLSIAALNLFGQVHWNKFPGNPVIEKGLPGDWDRPLISPSSVLYLDGVYHMWYWGGDLVTQNIQIGHATSPNGITWTKDTLNNPVLGPGAAGSWDDNMVNEPTVLFIDSVFHMWYNGHTGSDLSKDILIGHATSADGITWIKDTLNNPVLDVGPNGAWDDTWISCPSVVFYDNEYHMWYSAFDGTTSANVKIGHASSPDGIVWTKDPSNPILTSGNWDFPRVDFPEVVFDGAEFHMWYSGGEYFDWQIGYATSADGITWTKDMANNPVLETGATGSWDELSVATVAVMFDNTDSKFKMWYSGSSAFGAGDIGYAESAAPAWKQMKSMDIAKGLPVSCVIDNNIYVFGGTKSNLATLSVSQAYNTISREWSYLAAMPEDLYGGNAELINGNIYLIGGWRNTGNENWVTTDLVAEYDPGEDTWQEKTRIPEPMGLSASCVMNDTIYLLGGVKNAITQGNRKALYYKPGTDSWGTLPDMIYERPAGSSAEVIDNKIFVIGGTYKSVWYNPSGKVEMYDPELKLWTELADMPIPVIYHISVVHDKKIIVFGGDSTMNNIGIWGTSIGTDIIQEYDPSTDTWRLMEGMPFKRASMAGEKVGNFVYLLGGYLNSRDLDEPLSEVWRFDLDSLKAWNYVTGIGLDKHSIELELDGTEELVAAVSPPDASDLSVMWTSGDPGIASVSEGVVKGEGKGETYVYVTSVDGNFRDSCLVTVTFVEGINMVGERSIRIYPNPANDLLTIETIHSGHQSINITTLNGQLIYTGVMEGTSHQIDLTSFRKGVYFLTIRSDGFVRTRKIVKL